MMDMRSLLAGLGVFLLAATLCAADGTEKKSALDKPTLEAFVRHLLMWGPQIKVDISDPRPSELEGLSTVDVTGRSGAASQRQRFYVNEDGSYILRAAVFDIAKNPFAKDFERISVDSQPSMGTPGAPVRLVLFTDFQCPFCQQEAKLLRTNLLKTYPEEVRLYFKDYPLQSIHPWATEAAIAGRCFYAQSEDAFWAYHDWMFDHQKEITADNLRDKVLEFAGGVAGVDVLRLTPCIENQETKNEVAASVAQARALGLNSTPTLFVNGRRITQHLPWPNLKKLIDFELDYQKTANNAGDIDCCAVQLPTPLSQ